MFLLQKPSLTYTVLTICSYANFNQPQSNRPFINCRPQLIEMFMSLQIFRIVAPLKAKYFRNEYNMGWEMSLSV